MYGLKDGVDLSGLMGRTLIQMCVGQYQVQFVFDGEISISVEARFRVVSGETITEWEGGLPMSAAPALEFLGGKVCSIFGQPDGTLELNFGSGRQLVILDSSKEFESYQITMPGTTIVV